MANSLTGYWGYNPKTNSYGSISDEPFSLFPTIVNGEKQIVYCRKCHRWEYIAGFKQNVLKSQCGNLYLGPFVHENTIVSYGYNVQKVKEGYAISVKSQLASITGRRLFEDEYLLDFEKKVLFRDGVSVYENEDIRKILCTELTDLFIETMGEEYKNRYGIKPGVSSKLQGFNLVVGYMLAPFNVNFYKIAQHWGLNPYDKDFMTLSSGDTPTAENEMFESLGIKPTKAIRKMYQKFPQSVICYAAAQDLGFTDVNILQKTAGSHVYAFFRYYMISFAGGQITYNCRDYLKVFVKDLLQITNQKTVWNSLERTIGYLTERKCPEFVINDGLNAYYNCHDNLTVQEKKDVLSEGFNQYTHDFLVRRIHLINADRKMQQFQKNIVFNIEPEFLALEYKAGDDKMNVYNAKTQQYEILPVPDEDRYCFYVAKDSATLKTIGAAMHNCVGWGYTRSVERRHCTIVYAKYKNKHEICIEVTPEFTIRQSLGPCNCPLSGAAMDAYAEWCKEKNIQFVKAFTIHAAR